MIPPEPPISLGRFLWIQGFAARLQELGAPAAAEHLLDLGERLFESNADSDPQTVADAAWSRWPTDNGLLTEAEYLKPAFHAPNNPAVGLRLSGKAARGGKHRQPLDQ